MLCSACPQLLDDRFREQSDALAGRDADAPPLNPPPLNPPAVAWGDANSGPAAGNAATPASDAATPAGDATGSAPPSDGTADAGAGVDAPAESAGTCRSGSHPTASDACYALFETKLSWPSARARCQALGSGWDLASIRSSGDIAVLLPLVTSEMWVGASDQALEGIWLWIDNSGVFWRGSGTSGRGVDGMYINWDRNEPNGNDPSDCMRILPGAKWADFQCENALGYICRGPRD